MSFRGMLKCVSGACCTAVVMCASGVWGIDGAKMLGDPEKNSEFIRLANLRQCDPSFYVPICSDFPSFLGCCSFYPEKWPKALTNVSQNVTLLCSGKFNDDLKYAKPAVSGISSSYTFKEIVKFCRSDLCDTSSRERLLSLFYLVPMVIRELPVLSKEELITKGVLFSYVPKQVINDFSVFLCNLNKLSSTEPLVGISDILIFQHVAEVMSVHQVRE